MATLAPSCQGTWKLTTDPNVAITLGPNTYHHSVFGQSPIIVTGPTAFSPACGTASWVFQNGMWDVTMLQDIGLGPPGTVTRFGRG